MKKENLEKNKTTQSGILTTNCGFYETEKFGKNFKRFDDCGIYENDKFCQICKDSSKDLAKKINETTKETYC